MILVNFFFFETLINIIEALLILNIFVYSILIIIFQFYKTYFKMYCLINFEIYIIGNYVNF